MVGVRPCVCAGLGLVGDVVKCGNPAGAVHMGVDVAPEDGDTLTRIFECVRLGFSFITTEIV